MQNGKHGHDNYLVCKSVFCIDSLKDFKFTGFSFYAFCSSGINSFAALLLKLEKRIADVQIDSSELGFTKPGPYIYELLGDLSVTSKTANKLTGIIEEAALLLEEGELTYKIYL